MNNQYIIPILIGIVIIVGIAIINILLSLRKNKPSNEDSQIKQNNNESFINFGDTEDMEMLID